MADKDELLAAIAATGTGLTAKIDANHADLVGKVETIANGVGRIEADLLGKVDTIANGVGRIEAGLATVARDVLQIRVDLAAYRLQTDTRLAAVESRP